MNLFDTVRDALRTRHYAYRTEKTYLHWIRQYVRFVKPVHPRDAGMDGVKRYLTHLAVEKNVSATTQNQARASLKFLYSLYDVNFDDAGVPLARKSTWLPTVMSHDEAMRVIEQLNGQYRIMGQLMYGAGLRLLECLRLRVKDVDIESRTITLRDTKSNRDRVTCLPESVVSVLILHIAKVKAQHTIDLADDAEKWNYHLRWIASTRMLHSPGSGNISFLPGNSPEIRAAVISAGTMSSRPACRKR